MGSTRFVVNTKIRRVAIMATKKSCGTITTLVRISTSKAQIFACDARAERDPPVACTP